MFTINYSIQQQENQLQNTIFLSITLKSSLLGKLIIPQIHFGNGLRKRNYGQQHTLDNKAAEHNS